jgi:hypothetical protein
MRIFGKRQFSKGWATGVVLGVISSVAMVVSASSVTGLNTFTPNTPAVAADVNTNFTQVKSAVDDNDTRITALEGGAPGATCAGNDANDVMVRIGSLCVDKYEASVWDTAAGGVTQFGANADDYICNDGGSNCSTPGTQIFARSEANQTPSSQITWYQAQAACANSGKRLPTQAEWQLAANGTTDPGGGSDGSAGCNTGNLAKTLTGAAVNCESSGGAADMIGNVDEWTADLVSAAGDATTDTALVVARGGDYDGNGAGSGIFFVLTDLTGGATNNHTDPLDTRNVVGFRCVR